MIKKNLYQLVLIVLFFGAGCTVRQFENSTIRLATTTSTYDSGLLDHILPLFEAEYGVAVEIVAVGTGQALAIGRNGDADVLLVHAPALEEMFISEGFGFARYPVMYNDFVIVGPIDDPAGVKAASSGAEALRMIADSGFVFASRGDNSGTHAREKQLWFISGFDPSSTANWYYSLGQGMGETLYFAEQKDAYALTDRGTYLALADKLPHLQIVYGGSSIHENRDDEMLNFYSVIPVNADKFDSVRGDLAADFVAWILSASVQEQIGQFGADEGKEPLFFPGASQNE